MKIGRREFLKYCGLSAAALGLSTTDLGLLDRALADPDAPKVIWLQGASCVGCSISFLDRISTTAPQTAADVLISSINLVYHPTLMGYAGDFAVASAMVNKNAGNYVLVVEGGVPTAFGGHTCTAWTYGGAETTFQQAVLDFSAKAAKIVCVGTCAAYGGIPAAGPNPTGIKGVKSVIGKSTINISGCPPHPDWIVWAIVQILTNKSISVDSYGRPTAIYGKTVHELCPRREHEEAERFGLDGFCMRELGCRGPATRCNCPTSKWNNAVNWCIGANSTCLGCTEPGFPGLSAFYQEEEDDD